MADNRLRDQIAAVIDRTVKLGAPNAAWVASEVVDELRRNRSALDDFVAGD